MSIISSRLILVSPKYTSIVGCTGPGSYPVLVYRGCVGVLSSPNLVLQFILLPISFRLAVRACFCGCPGYRMNFGTFISGMVRWCDEKFATNCFDLVRSPFRSFCLLYFDRHLLCSCLGTRRVVVVGGSGREQIVSATYGSRGVYVRVDFSLVFSFLFFLSICRFFSTDFFSSASFFAVWWRLLFRVCLFPS